MALWLSFFLAAASAAGLASLERWDWLAEILGVTFALSLFVAVCANEARA
jgi:hypothetical protein